MAVPKRKKSLMKTKQRYQMQVIHQRTFVDRTIFYNEYDITLKLENNVLVPHIFVSHITKKKRFRMELPV